MPLIPITTTFIALYVLTIVPMTGWVGLMRGKLDVLRGHGNDPVLEKRVRIHGNLIENGPAVALMLGASEIMGAPSWALWLTIGAFAIGRVIHYIQFDEKTRAGGMSFTQFPAAFLAIWCLYSIYLA